MAEDVVEVTDDSYEGLIKGDKPVLLDFWAPWCGPCRAVAPIVEDIAKANAGKAIVGKVNVDDNQQIATKLGITSIPTLIVFKKGEISARVVGRQDKATLQKMLDAAM
ncbi:MAG: thioredoxin [Candidatus Sumerlaeota bacterium]|nr:thioredoxin [Candidatus Sumerlaeota bacterium]